MQQNDPLSLVYSASLPFRQVRPNLDRCLSSALLCF